MTVKELNSDLFSILHLNINSLFSKAKDLNEILDTGLHDIVILNETKLQQNVPLSFCTNTNYKILRRDRINCGGGGVMVFIKNKYTITKTVMMSKLKP